MREAKPSAPPPPPPLPSWNRAIDAADMSYSGAGGCTATKTGGDGYECDASAVSQHPVNGFKLRVNYNGASYNGVCIGLISYPSHFTPTDDNCDKSNMKSFCMNTSTGSLYGNGVSGKRYSSAVPDGALVECVRDRVNRNISFVVNGVDQGVAFTGVPDEELHALANFYTLKVSVTFVQ